MELVTGIEPVTLSLPRIRSADWATPAQWTFTSLWFYGCGDRTWTCDLRVMSPTSYQLLHPAMNGGGRRIRTFEVEDGRFTVCSLWPLGNPSKNNGAGDRNWTHNLLITSQLLYLLSYASIITTRCILTFASLSVKNFLKLFISFISFTVVSLSAISIYHESFFDASIFFKFVKLHSFLIGKKI